MSRLENLLNTQGKKSELSQTARKLESNNILTELYKSSNKDSDHFKDVLGKLSHEELSELKNVLDTGLENLSDNNISLQKNIAKVLSEDFLLLKNNSGHSTELLDKSLLKKDNDVLSVSMIPDEKLGKLSSEALRDSKNAQSIKSEKFLSEKNLADLNGDKVVKGQKVNLYELKKLNEVLKSQNEKMSAKHISKNSTENVKGFFKNVQNNLSAQEHLGLHNGILKKAKLAKNPQVKLDNFYKGQTSFFPKDTQNFVDKGHQKVEILGEILQVDPISSDNELSVMKDSLPENLTVERKLMQDGHKTNGLERAFDIGKLTQSESEDTIINQIKNYIIQTSHENQKDVRMVFNHGDLGDVQLLVSKDQGNQVSISINTQTSEGASFFQQKQSELLQSLQSNGIQISEFKLESSLTKNSSFEANEDSSNKDSQKFFSRSNQQGKDEQSHQRERSEKRNELWEVLKEYEGAA